MKIIKVLMSTLFVIAIVISQAAVAKDTFRGNVGIEYSQTDYDDSLTEKYTEFLVDAEIYLTAVEKKNHPWKEAAFLERASSINVLTGWQKYDVRDFNSIDGPLFSIGGTYASKNHPVILQAQYSYDNLLYQEDDVESETDDTLFTFGIGAYINDNLALLAEIGKGESESTVSFFGETVDEEKSDTDTYGLSAKYVAEFGANQAFGIYGGYLYSKYKPEGQESSSAKVFAVVPEYYFNQKTSLALQLAKVMGDEDNDDVTLIGLNFNAFLGPDFALNLGFQKADYQDSDISDVDTITLKGSFWF